MGFLLLTGTTIFLASVVAFLVYPGFRIVQNYQQVRKHGLPIIISPFSILNPFWILTHQRLLPMLYFLYDNLPPPLNHALDFIQFTTRDWTFTTLYTRRKLPFSCYTPAFFIVSPGETQIVVCDPIAAEDVLSRMRKDFIKSRAMYEPIEVFGPNVDSVNGEDWARQRRITAPPFNERNSQMVWKESLRQASAMLALWVKGGTTGVLNTPKDTLLLALHVLSGAGLGKTLEFGSGVQEASEGYTMSYRDALREVLVHVFDVIITSKLPQALPSFLLPPAYQRVRIATAELKGYMRDMVREEREKIKAKEVGRDNLMSALVRSADFEAGGNSRSALTDQEILGNLFIYNFAGHDTTAHTLAYAIYMLAAEPKIQNWIVEEIEAVFQGLQQVEDWEYEAVFPKLNRCLALMFETLRHYGPVPALPKYTADASPSLTIQSKTYILTPRTYVIINNAANHTNPAYWGDDALEFRPDRFIKADTGSLEDEELRQVPAGNFIPWASGPRVCPGRKFAQVEFVAVIARLFSRHRVEPKLVAGETQEMASERVKRCVLDSGLTLTLTMKHPERVQLVWKERN